ncbi:hypothetical protein FRC04_007645 [Tulasnella sp. 424]|nr:hypothetical protein FRC04_007645 [Tulasnella sp. 424]KAG8979077.1 hypothetical protein FRC05_009287 [Tulasnella sp. 425]
MEMQAFSGTNSTPATGRNDIYKLPVEILIQIFLSAYLTSEHYTRFQLPFKLVSVTSFWRKLVLSEPRLWTYTFYGKARFEPQPTPPIQSFLFQLSQSGSRPLEIAIDLRWKKEFIDELIDAILLH